MDRTLERQANIGLADLAQDGGGTYQAGTLLKVVWPVGYVVGIGGVALPAANVDAATFVWAARMAATEYNGSFVGTWLDEGRVYFDAVEYFGADRREDAIQRGIALGQKAIYDFGAQADIILPAWGTEAHDR
jgi:hypothetical protein